MTKPVLFFCKSCGEEIILLERIDTFPYCGGCWLEKNKGFVPVVSDSSLPAPGTGTVPRQQVGRGKTS